MFKNNIIHKINLIISVEVNCGTFYFPLILTLTFNFAA